MSRRFRRLGALAAAVVLIGVGSARAQAPAAAPDSLQVTFCGTSGPLPIRDRAKTCVVVQAAGKLYLVDVGPESVKNLMLWRLPLATAKAVFLTHLHSDHIGDVGEFNMQSWVAGREAPLALIGPSGTDKVAKGYNLAYEDDHRFRNAHHEHGEVKLPIAAGLMAPQVVTMPPVDAQGGATKVVLKDGDLTVTAITVAHNPVTPAFGYRFDFKGRSVVISGDTRKWPPLATAAKGADVLIHEAQNSDMTKAMSKGLAGLGNARMSSIMADTLSYHTTPVEAAEIARMAGVKRLVLYHLTQAGLPAFTPEAFTRGMDAGGPLDWRLAKDGMTIELPAGSDEIRFGQN